MAETIKQLLAGVIRSWFEDGNQTITLGRIDALRCADALDVCEQATENAAKLTEALITQKPFCDQSWARMTAAVAARAIRRGRHLTEVEKINNLADAFAEEGDHEIADKIRRMGGCHG